LTFLEAVGICLRKYADFNGRASKTEYWWFFLFVNAICWPLRELDHLTFALAFWATILPHIAVAVRRLHDTGKNGWYILVGSIPVVGWIILLYLLMQDSVEPGGGDDGFAPA
jgi:uncharacterized membrane protein YhaH (DUF805 family)